MGQEDIISWTENKRVFNDLEFHNDSLRGYYLVTHGMVWHDVTEQDHLLKQFLLDSSSRGWLSLAEYLTYNLPINHEYYHFLQSVTTTYFLFINELRWFRTRTARSLLRHLEDKHLLNLLSPPLIQNLIERDYFSDPIIELLVSSWNSFKLWEILFEGNHIPISNMAIANAIADYCIIAGKQEFAKSFENKTGRNLPRILGSKFRIGPAQLKYQPPLIGGKQIIEAAAAVASLWFAIEHTKKIEKILHLIEKIHPERDVDPIRFALEHFVHRRCLTFFQTFLCICDLALNPPIYYEHALLSKNPIDLEEIIPGLRFVRIIELSSKIKPVINVENDFTRFITQVESMTGWIDQCSIIRKGARLTLDARNNWIKRKYTKTQTLRRRYPWKFCIPGLSLFDGSLIRKICPPWIRAKDRMSGIYARNNREDIIRSLNWFVINTMHEFMIESDGFHWDTFFTDDEFVRGNAELTAFYLKEWYRWDRVPYF